MTKEAESKEEIETNLGERRDDLLPDSKGEEVYHSTEVRRDQQIGRKQAAFSATVETNNCRERRAWSVINIYNELIGSLASIPIQPKLKLRKRGIAPVIRNEWRSQKYKLVRNTIWKSLSMMKLAVQR